MLHKGMLKNADGTPMKKDDECPQSAPILNGSYAYNAIFRRQKAAIAGIAEARQRTRRPSTASPTSKKGFNQPPPDWDPPST